MDKELELDFEEDKHFDKIFKWADEYFKASRFDDRQIAKWGFLEGVEFIIKKYKLPDPRWFKDAD